MVARAAEIGLDFDNMSPAQREDAYAEAYDVLIKVSSYPIWISESPRLTVDEIRAQALMKRARGDLDVILVDYLQLLSAPETGRRRMSSVEVIEHNTRELKILARELDIPVLVLCQLNREVEKRGRDKRSGTFRPTLGDLRGSGSIEQDADWVVFLYRHDHYVDRGEADADEQRKDRLEFIVGKARTAAIKSGGMAYFDPSRARLEDEGPDNDRPGA